MLSDGKIIDIAEDFESQYMHGGVTFDEFDSIGFARAIEREATAPLIEQIKEDEALMRQAAQVISWQSFGECRAFCDGQIPTPEEVVEAIRQRLEAKT